MWNDCLHTELKFITLSIVVSWSDIILLLITKGHTLQIHWTNQTKSTKGNTRMNHKQLLQRCSCTYLFLQLYLKCKKVVVIHINSLVMNSCHFQSVEAFSLKKHLKSTELTLAGAIQPSESWMKTFHKTKLVWVMILLHKGFRSDALIVSLNPQDQKLNKWCCNVSTAPSLPVFYCFVIIFQLCVWLWNHWLVTTECGRYKMKCPLENSKEVKGQSALHIIIDLHSRFFVCKYAGQNKLD